MATPVPLSPFQVKYRGYFVSLLSWTQLETFWAVLKDRGGLGWYVYAVGQPLPKTPRSKPEVAHFIAQIDALLHRDHDEDYCGIVYTDSRDEPTFIKIFDPNHLGVSCGSSKNPPPPGWILSLVPPDEIPPGRVVPEGRTRWWQALWAAA